METFGLNKIVDALGNAFSVFDFSFFISGAATFGFITLDLHYYGYDGILHLTGWVSVVIYILAIYICGLMSWSIGKLMRWVILRFIFSKKGGIRGEFDAMFDDISKSYPSAAVGDNQKSKDVKYSEMWIEIEKESSLQSKLNSLNKMWVMVALFEGLSFSWLVGFFVYLDGLLFGKWISVSNVYSMFVPCIVLLGFMAASLHRATIYSRDLVKDVITTYYTIK